MKKSILMCLAGKRPSQCGRVCSTCFSQDAIMIHCCDKCGRELDDNEYTFDGSPELCSGCQKGEENEVSF